MTNLSFAPGESNVYAQKFSPSVILFWLKTETAVTNVRVVAKKPNTLLGLIPLGYQDEAYPLASIASAGVEIKFSVGRALFGIIFFFIGIATIKSPVGFIFLLIGISMILNSLSAALKLTNNGGGVSYLKVSALEKAKLENFRNEVNSRLFADHQGMRHQETMSMHQMNLLNQQAQLNLQQQLNTSITGNSPVPPPPA